MTFLFRRLIFVRVREISYSKWTFVSAENHITRLSIDDTNFFYIDFMSKYTAHTHPIMARAQMQPCDSNKIKCYPQILCIKIMNVCFVCRNNENAFIWSRINIWFWRCLGMLAHCVNLNRLRKLKVQRFFQKRKCDLTQLVRCCFCTKYN